MTRLKPVFAMLAAAVILAAPTFARTKTHALSGTVGPGFTISMSRSAVKTGAYIITVRDRATIHNFHLSGPGVNKKTSIPATGTTKWTVTLRKGTYHFVCDPHRTIMHGVLNVT
jgi:plastocyanin